MTASHADRIHARFSGSQAHRWSTCTGSVALIESLPLQPQSAAAAEGEKAHEYLEAVAKEFLNHKITGENDGLVLPDASIELKETADEYIKILWEKVLEQSLTGKAYGFEETFTLVPKLAYGTADFWDVHINDKAHRVGVIGDFKYGYHYVEVKKNPQLAFYATAMREEFKLRGKDLDEVRTFIYQPRGPSPVFREYKYTAKSLDGWKKRFVSAIKTVLSGKGKLKTGPQCEFCPAQAVCPKFSKQVLSSMDLVEIKDRELVAPESLPDEKLVRIIKERENIKAFLEACEIYAISKIQSGHTIEGLKVVKPQGKRKWIDDEISVSKELLKLGCKTVWKEKLIGITEAEKQLKSKVPGSLTDMTDPKPIVVLDSDRRESEKNVLELMEV